MLPARNLSINSLFRILLQRSVSNILGKCLIQNINVERHRNIGYLVSKLKYSNNDSNLNKLNPKLITHFSSDSSTSYTVTQGLTPIQFEKVSNETLDSLTEYFDELIEGAAHLTDADVSYGDGVLTIKFGNPYGTYVINRQTPNKQIWLSSPKSGPKRYDFINGKWIYKHDGKTLHELLNNEIPAVVRDQVNFDKCSFSGKEKDAAFKSL